MAANPDPARDARRSQLVNAAIDCIAQYGLENTTVARVTSKAGLSAGTVNFYFSSKDQLLSGVLSSVRDEFTRAMLERVKGQDAAERIIQSIVDVHFDADICSVEKVAVWYGFASASRHRADYEEICGAFDAELSDIVESAFQQLCEQSGVTHYRPEALAQGLIGLLDGLWQQLLYAPDNFDHHNARELALDYLRSLFPELFGVSSGKSLEPQPVVGTPGTSDLLPTWTYANPEFFELEVEQLFKTHWILAGHVSQLTKPQDYITFDGFGERAIVIRGVDNQIRAFHNVCRHRGARLLEDQGTCPHSLSCPFHGWTYDLEGKLIGIPAQKTFEGLDPGNNGLVPVEMEIWMGFVFLRFHRGGIQGDRSMKQLMAPVEELIAPYQIDQMEMLPNTAYRELRPYNWKVIHDIDNEGYHVPVGHPSLQQLYGGNYTDDTVDGISVSRGYLNDRKARSWSVRQYKNLLPTYEHLPEDNQRLWLYIGIFPNMVIGLYPESIEYYMTIPEDVNNTWYQGARFGLKDGRRETDALRFLNKRINDETEAEDESFVRGLQDGMRSSAFPEQRLSSLEAGVRSFHKAIQTALPVATLSDQPTANQVSSLNQRLQSRSHR